MPSNMRKTAETEVPMIPPMWLKVPNLVEMAEAVAATTREVMTTILEEHQRRKINIVLLRSGKRRPPLRKGGSRLDGELTLSDQEKRTSLPSQDVGPRLSAFESLSQLPVTLLVNPKPKVAMRFGLQHRDVVRIQSMSKTQSIRKHRR